MSPSQLTLVSVLCIDPHTSTVLIMYFPRNIRFRSSKNNEHLYICLDQDGGCEATEEGGALLNNTPSSSSFLSCLGIVNHTPHQSSSLPAKKLSQLIEESHPPNLTRSSNKSPCILCKSFKEQHIIKPNQNFPLVFGAKISAPKVFTLAKVISQVWLGSGGHLT